ncbi:hypothetical protein, partial [Moorena bouillonii]
EEVVHVSNLKQSSSIGVGLNGLADWSSQFPFLNVMHWSREWYDWDRRTSEGIEVDRYGWLKSVESGVTAGTVFLTNIEEMPIVYNSYVVRWKGKGHLDYGGCVKEVSKAYGGDLIQVGHDSCFIRVVGFDSEDPLRDITIVPEKHIQAFDRGAVFNPDFIERVKVFRALRFMDWMVTNGSEQQEWENRPTINDRSFAKKGVPLEYMVLLANIVGADPWFNMPHKANSNYIHNFAVMVKERLDNKLTAYVEHSNEVWNWIFPQTHFALSESKKLWGAEGDAYMQWHGMRTAGICDIWKKEVFIDDSHRVNCVLGAQASWFGLETPALECPLWKQRQSACYEHGIDSIAIAGYFTGCINNYENDSGNREVEKWLKEPDGGMQKAYEQALDSRHFECEYSAKTMQDVYEYHAGVAKKLGLQLVAYEGGQHITGNFHDTQDDENFIGLHIRLNRDERMYNLYQRNFQSWKKAGGGLFMHFVDVSIPGKHGSWGALEYITQPSSPKWRALMHTNKRPCWWRGCSE